jgi:hypothetical protein
MSACLKREDSWQLLSLQLGQLLRSQVFACGQGPSRSVRSRRQSPETTGVERLAIACGKALIGPVDSITIFYLALAQIVITHPY